MVAFDAVGPAGGGGTHSATSPVTWTHVNAGNGILVTVIDSAGTNTPSAVTYGGVSIPFLKSVTVASNTGECFLYGLISASLPQGSNTVSVTIAGGDDVICGSVSFTSAGQFGTAVSAASNAGTSLTVTVAATVTGGQVLVTTSYGGGAGGGSFSGTNSVTIQWQNSVGTASAADNGAAGTVASTGGGASQTAGISNSAGADWFGMVAVEIQPPAVVPVPPPLPQASARTITRRSRRKPQQQPPPPPSPFVAGAAALAGTGSLSTAVTIRAGATLAGTGSLSAFEGPRFITGLSGSTSSDYWTDQSGSPRAMFSDTVWPIIYQAGKDTTHTYQQEMDFFTSTRAAQGYTAFECNALPNTAEGDFAGKTWDSVNAFAGTNDPSSGLNSTYWQRLDYLLSSAAAQGITVFLNLLMADDITTGVGMAASWTNTQFTNYGNAVATRYLNTKNLIWMIGDDYFGNNDTQLSAILTGVRNAGDTRPIAIENYTETTSRRDFGAGTAGNATAWGLANANYQWVYSYNVAYLGVEYAYTETSPIPVMRGDGFYLDGTAAGDQIIRQHTWWALSSGSRGFSGGTFDGSMGKFAAGWRSDLTSGSYQGSAGSGWVSKIITFFSGLSNWNKLIPDTGNVFITAGRGTRATAYTSGQGSTPAYSGTSDTYVSGAITAAGDLALIYWGRGASSTITIDQTKMVSGYTAHWVDPASGATSGATPGSTFTPPASANSAGDHDWALVLQAPVSTPQGTATLAGAGSLSTAVILAAPGTLAGAGSLSTAVILAAPGTLAGAGSLSTAVILAAPGTLAGTGSLGTIAGQGSGGTLGGAGSLGTAVTLTAPGTLAGAGSLSTAVILGATAALAGTGSLSAQGVIAGSATLAGAGSVSTAAGAGGALGGQGSLSTGVNLLAPATLGGQGSLSAGATQGTTGTVLGGAGSVSAFATQGTTGTVLDGRGSVTAAVTQGAPATLSGAGSLGTAVTQAVAALLAGTGMLTGLASMGSSMQGQGSIAAPPAVLLAPAVLAGTGGIAGVGGIAGAASLNGTGSLAASATVSGGASAVLAGAGSLNTPATAVLAPATLAGAGSLAGSAVQGAGTALAGTGSLAASGFAHPPQVKGGSINWSASQPYPSSASVTETANCIASVSEAAGSAASVS